MRQGSRVFPGMQAFPNGNRGYTLVELIVVMAIFIVIIIVTSYAFEQLLSRSVQSTRSAESNIEGIVGFEHMRQDIEHAGFGLPWSFQDSSLLPLYKECNVAAETLANGVDSTSFNDVPPDAPRPVVSGTSSEEVNGGAGQNGGLGPDYLVVKSTLASIESAARKWSYITYAENSLSTLKQWGTADDFVANDRAITLNTGFTPTGATRQLVLNPLATGTSVFYWTVSGANPPAAFQPGDSSQLFMAYGVAGIAPKMPYNRADFFLSRRPDEMPGRCNAGTGLLYKAVANHGDSGFTLFPLVDCVGDMQVEFELIDTSGNMVVTESLAGLSAAEIRSRLKTVRVYFLSHEGTKDNSFKYPITDAAKVLRVGDRNRDSSGRTWSSASMESTFGSDWRNYRWKIYTLAVRPKNLN